MGGNVIDGVVLDVDLAFPQVEDEEPLIRDEAFRAGVLF